MDELSYRDSLNWSSIDEGTREYWADMIADVDLPPLELDAGIDGNNLEDVPPAQIAKMLRSDPILSSKVLAVANSAAMGVTTRITDLERAVVHLGSALIETLIATYQMELILKNWPTYPREHFDYVKHLASAASIIAQHFAMAAKAKSPQTLNTAALLSHLGEMVLGMCPQPPDKEFAAAENLPQRFTYEYETWDLTSPPLSQKLTERWNLPAPLPEYSGQYWIPMFADAQAHDQGKELTIICAANVLATAFARDRDISPRQVFEQPEYEQLRKNSEKLGLYDRFIDSWVQGRFQRELRAATEAIS